jgi:HSP20 family protein
MGPKSLIPISRERGLSAAGNPFMSLQREIERLFDDFARGFPSIPTLQPFGGTSALVMPSMDVTETDKEIEITAELPGLEEKDLQINVADDRLIIRGEKKAEKEEKDKNYRMVERSYGSFERTLELPKDVDVGAIKATIAKGVLKVMIPKPAPVQAKKIQVNSAA